MILPVVARSVPPAYRSTAMGIASAGGLDGAVRGGADRAGADQRPDWPARCGCCPCSWPRAAPLAYYLRGRPQVHAGPHQSLAAAVRQAVRHPSFHFLFWSYFVCGFHTAFITLHLPAYVTDGGLTAAQGPPRLR